MDSGAGIVWGALVLIFLIIVGVSTYQNRHGRRRRTFSGPGPAALGSIYDLLNQDKRNAIELIVEDRAAERDEEHADDTLDDADTHLTDSDPRRPR
jgi:hypothetical protein